MGVKMWFPEHGWIVLGDSDAKRELFIELDDGKILTGKPDQFDGKNPWVSC